MSKIVNINTTSTKEEQLKDLITSIQQVKDSLVNILKLDSNPEFTGSVLVAYARAAHRLSKKGESGARSVFDIAPAMLSQMTPEELRAHML